MKEQHLNEQMRRGVKAATSRIYSKNSEPSLHRDRFNKENEEEWRRSFEVFQRFLAKHPEIPKSPEGGVAQSVQQLFERYCDFTNPLSENDFEFALSNLRSQIVLVRVPTTAEAKEALIAEIIGLLATGGKYTQFDLQTERKKMSVNQWTVEKLTQRRDEIKEKQRLAKFSASEVRQQLQAQRPQPQEIVLPAEYSAQRIRSMSSTEIKGLIRRFGAAATNNRLFGRA